MCRVYCTSDVFSACELGCFSVAEEEKKNDRAKPGAGMKTEADGEAVVIIASCAMSLISGFKFFIRFDNHNRLF